MKFRRKITAALAAAALLLTGTAGMLPVSAVELQLAAESQILAKGTHGVMTYENYGGYVVITGCSTAAASVDIPAYIDGVPVTGIGDMAFYYCTNLTSVTLPNTLTSIGAQAFQYCEKLQSPVIPEGVRSIGTEAFYGCYAITSVSLPSTLTSLGEGAFTFCKMSSVVLPAGLTSIPDSTFYYCTNLTSVTIPASVTTIGVNAFECCDALEEIVLPPSIECIPANAFRNCTSLRKVIIPAGVRRIGFSAFANCKNLTQVTIPESVYRIEESAFFSSGLQNVVLPAKVKVDYTSFQNTPCFGELQKTRPDSWKHMYTTNAEFFGGLIFCILIFVAFCWVFVSC